MQKRWNYTKFALEERTTRSTPKWTVLWKGMHRRKKMELSIVEAYDSVSLKNCKGITTASHGEAEQHTFYAFSIHVCQEWVNAPGTVKFTQVAVGHSIGTTHREVFQGANPPARIWRSKGKVHRHRLPECRNRLLIRAVLVYGSKSNVSKFKFPSNKYDSSKYHSL